MEALTAIQSQLSNSSVVQAKLDRLKETVGRVVGSTFYGTLLQQMRESSLKSEIGHGGRGEEVFAAQLHGLLAEEMGASKSGGVAEALYKRLEHQQRLISEQVVEKSENTNERKAS